RPPPPDTDQGDPVAHLLCHAHDLCPSTGLSTRRRVELAFSWSQPMSKRQRDVSAKTVSSCVFWIASSGFGTSLTVRNLVNGHALTSADFMPTELVLLIILAGLTFTGLLRRQRKANVLEGEILQPERRALPDRSRVKRLLLAAVPVLVASTAHADDWQQ